MPLRFMYSTDRLHIVNAAPKEQLERVTGPLTDKEYEDFVFARSIPDEAMNVVKLPDDWTPPDTDRTFRNAWRQTQQASVVVDMPAARDIWRDHLRKLRAPKLAALDIAYQRADEAGDAQLKRDIATQKQALRDVTADSSIEAAQTPDELRQAIPAILLV